MARDPVAPVDPEQTQDRSVNPSIVRTPPTPPGDGGIDDDSSSDYSWWLRDGATPYRADPDETGGFEVFSQKDNAWMRQYSVDKDKMWPSSAGEIAGMIGGRQRLNEPVAGTMPIDPGPDEDFAADDSTYMQEAEARQDVSAYTSPDDIPQQPPISMEDDGTPSELPPITLPEGAMNEQQIRDAGLAIDVPFEAPMPVALKYKDTGQQVWTPPPGWQDQVAGGESQEGAEGGGSSGETGPGT